MSELKEGVRVIVFDRDTNEIKKGVIDKAYSEMEIAIVKFDDGNIEKVPYEHLHIESENDVQETTEPVEKSEITITPEEFQKIAVGVITEESLKGGPLLNAIGTILVSKLHKALFRSEVE